MLGFITDFIKEVIEQNTQRLQDRIDSLSDETEELRRRLHLMNRLGVVSEVHENNRLIRVKYGELETPFIKWFAFASGRVSHYRLPSLDEQVLLVNYGAGNTGKQFIGLVGIDSMQFPIPATTVDQVVTNYGENCSQIWDMKAGTLTFKAPEFVKFETKLLHTSTDLQVDSNADITANIKAGENIQAGENVAAGGDVSDGKSSIDDMRDVFNEHPHPSLGAPPSVRME